MESLWFVLVALMITVYVVLDGFDIGAGIVQLLVSRTDAHRQQVLRAIGPVWDGNEVWLLSASGTMYFAFPLLYASSFSGFYLPLMMVLWLLMGRAISIEFRHHSDSPVWREAFDVIFCGSSVLLAIFFGAALGNVVRGVPLNADGYFFEPLWTNFRTTGQTGILDWYTVLCGVVALATLTLHGSLYIALKTEGDLNERAHQLARKTWYGLVVVTLLSLFGTFVVRPNVLANFREHVIGFVIPVLVVGGLAGIYRFQHASRDDWKAFVSSCAFIVGMLGGAAFSMYPYVLPSTTDPSYALTIHNTATGAYGLKIGLIWWSIAMILGVGYFTYVYRMFRGKVSLGEGGGH
jgi:cytochrome d ubiquinol oxidase subunit II